MPDSGPALFPVDSAPHHGAPVCSAPPAQHDFRTVHYLGSKRRLLRPIREAVEEVAAPGDGICDLFAGSGTVSRHLGVDWSITAADIQEYSRALCNGLLNAPANSSMRGADLRRAIFEGSLRPCLYGTLGRLIEHEQECLRRAQSGELASLCSGAGDDFRVFGRPKQGGVGSAPRDPVLR